MKHEYRVIPAPERARKKRGFKGAALFAHEMETVINELAAEGWSYLRTDTLPHEERSGLTNKTTTYRNLLVFMRPLDEAVVQPVAAPATAEAPEPKSADAEPGEGDDEIVNLWHPSEADAEASSGPDRQR